MAQKVETVLIDDLDGSPADTTIRFSLEGRHYELDLTAKNAKELRKVFRPYTRKARTVVAPKPTQQTSQIRSWAQENGYEVSTRGRVSNDIVEAYHDAIR